MDELNSLIERIEKAEGITPAKAEFGCGAYGDGSGYELTVGYDANQQGRWSEYILLDGFTLTFREEHAEEVIAAIRYCAAALRARKEAQ